MPATMRYEQELHYGSSGHRLAFDVYRQIAGGTLQEAVDLEAAEAVISCAITRANGAVVLENGVGTISEDLACRGIYTLTGDDVEAMPPGIYNVWWRFRLVGVRTETFRRGPIELRVVASSAPGTSTDNLPGGPLFTDPGNLIWGVTFF